MVPYAALKLHLHHLKIWQADVSLGRHTAANFDFCEFYPKVPNSLINFQSFSVNKTILTSKPDLGRFSDIQNRTKYSLESRVYYLRRVL